MKKMILAIGLTLCMSFAFAGKEDVSPKVLNAFNNDFSTAKEVEWSIGSDYFKAAFTFNGNHVFAFYNRDGELLALTRYISSLDLPINLQKELKKNYKDYWISDLFEVANTEGTSYYITLENAEKKIVLKAPNGDNWTTFKKISKA
jgi:hypothetical protein